MLYFVYVQISLHNTDARMWSVATLAANHAKGWGINDLGEMELHHFVFICQWGVSALS